MARYQCRGCRDTVSIRGELGYDPRGRRAFVLCPKCNATNGATSHIDDARELVGELLGVVPIDKVMKELARVCAERQRASSEAKSREDERAVLADAFTVLDIMADRLAPYA